MSYSARICFSRHMNIVGWDIYYIGIEMWILILLFYFIFDKSFNIFIYLFTLKSEILVIRVFDKKIFFLIRFWFLLGTTLNY
jgi:hypothetical protein